MVEGIDQPGRFTENGIFKGLDGTTYLKPVSQWTHIESGATALGGGLAMRGASTLGGKALALGKEFAEECIGVPNPKDVVDMARGGWRKAKGFFGDTSSKRFVNQMLPEEAARYRDYWGGYSDYQKDISGAGPFGMKKNFTQSGDVETVTTFDEYGRPYKQYGINEGEPFHEHGFEYPTNPQPGTGWKPIRKLGVPIE